LEHSAAAQVEVLALAVAVATDSTEETVRQVPMDTVVVVVDIIVRHYGKDLRLTVEVSVEFQTAEQTLAVAVAQTVDQVALAVRVLLFLSIGHKEKTWHTLQK
jgi:hypothetical protein